MVVARNLGHSDTRMVEKHYGHSAPSYIADAIRAAAPKFGIEPDRNVVSIDARPWELAAADGDCNPQRRYCIDPSARPHSTSDTRR
jgi:hypothetical protein